MKKRLFLCLALILLVTVFLTGCGSKNITEKKLKEGLEKYINSEYNTSDYEVSLKDDKIIVTYDDKKYNLAYNIDENPIFTYEVKIEKGISYDDYYTKTENLSLPMLGYISSAYTYGVDIEDSSTYFALSYVDGMMDNYDGEGKYIIVDDAEGLETDAEIILTSEFGDRVIDFINDSYEKGIKISDKENNTYTYELTANCEENSCQLVAELTVNQEGNFENIKEYADELAKENMYEEITPETADYHIELKIGQNIEINGKDLNGYELSGMNVVDVDGHYTFTATSEGIANGYLYVGEETTKSIYITVTKPEKNEKFENKILNI